MALTTLKDIKEQARRTGVGGFSTMTKQGIMYHGSKTALGLEILASMIRAYLKQRERVGLDNTPRLRRIK